MQAAGYHGSSVNESRRPRRVLKEEATSEGGGSSGMRKTPSEIKLSKDGDFKPFTVSDESHSNLRVLVQAFLDSDRVPIPGPDGTGPLTTIEKDKGETVPRLKKKTIYLVGGAVRDHLRGKTPKDYDLATDATPDEIRLILRHAGFTEVRPQTGKHAPKDKRYDKHPEGASKAKTYYAKGWDRAGREFVMGVKIHGQEFEVATFRKDSKGGDGRTPDRMEFAGLEDDAARRDFTINSMYIPLTNANGDNNRVIDPHGGAHHLRAGEVRFVGDPKERLEEDQLRALRYIRFLSRRGMNGNNIPPDYKEAIQAIRELPAVSKERIRDEFIKGLEHPETDTRMMLKVYKDLGLLDTVFPKMQFKLDKDDDFTDKKDRRLVTAHLLRHNHPDDVKSMLGGTHWPNNEVNDIIHLLKMSSWGQSYKTNPDQFFSGFYDVKSNQARTSLVPSLIRSWAKMTGMDEEAIEHYLSHELSTRGMVAQPNGVRTVNPEIVQRLGRVPQGEDFGRAIRDIESEKFRQRFKSKK